MLNPLRLLEPTSVAEASSELRRHGEQARIYGGGAELVLLMRHGMLSPDYLVDIKRIPGIRGVSTEGDAVRIGAATTHSAVQRDDAVRQYIPSLACAASTIGNVRVRGVGTIGGNLCFADPHSDPAAPLLVHEARVVLENAERQRTLALDDFMVGMYETAIEADEVLTAVEVPRLPQGFGSAFLRIERYHRPTVNVAGAVLPVDGRIAQARLAIGCIGTRTVRLRELEKQVIGLTAEDAERVVREYRRPLTDLLDPVDDLLGSTSYKTHIACVLLSRAIGAAMRAAADGE